MHSSSGWHILNPMCFFLHEEPALSPFGNGTSHSKSSKCILMPHLKYKRSLSLHGSQSIPWSLRRECSILHPCARWVGQRPGQLPLSHLPTPAQPKLPLAFHVSSHQGVYKWASFTEKKKEKKEFFALGGSSFSFYIHGSVTCNWRGHTGEDILNAVCNQTWPALDPHRRTHLPFCCESGDLDAGPCPCSRHPPSCSLGCVSAVASIKFLKGMDGEGRISAQLV